jgi:hypothetical protein
MVKDKEKEDNIGLMVVSILVTGKIIKPMEEVDSFMLMEMYMKVNG